MWQLGIRKTCLVSHTLDMNKEITWFDSTSIGALNYVFAETAKTFRNLVQPELEVYHLHKIHNRYTVVV